MGSLPPPLRACIGLLGLVNLAGAALFATRHRLAVELWPWDMGPLSFLFLASMLSAVGVAALWISVSGEAGSLPGGFLNLAVALGGAGAYLWSRPGTRGAGAAVVALAVINGVLAVATRRIAPVGGPPLPRLVRGSYLVFTAVLLIVGVALIFRVPGVMPWPLDEDSSVVFGWIFFGDAWYFAYALAVGRWGAARAQLWSFLGYNGILLAPLLLHLANVPPERLPNLLVYLAVLGYSTVLGVYYLVLNPRTRGWGAAAPTA